MNFGVFHPMFVKYYQPEGYLISFTTALFVNGNSCYAWSYKGEVKHTYGKSICQFIPSVRYKGHAEYHGAVNMYQESVPYPIFIPMPLLINNSSEDTLISWGSRDKQKPKNPYKYLNTYNMYLHLMNKNILSINVETWYTDVPGTLMIYKTMKHGIGGAYENLNTVKSVLGTEFTNKKLIYGKDVAVINDRQVISNKEGLYYSSLVYPYTSTNTDKYISEDTIFNNAIKTFKIGSYSFLQTRNGVHIYFITNESLLPLFSTSGEYVDNPVVEKDSVYFAVVLDSKIRVYVIKQGEVTNVAEINHSPKDIYMYRDDNLMSGVLIYSVKNDSKMYNIVAYALSDYGISRINSIVEYKIGGNSYSITDVKIYSQAYFGMNSDPVVYIEVSNEAEEGSLIPNGNDFIPKEEEEEDDKGSV
jgi:hypothetical protein